MKNTFTKRRQNSGFTIVELIVVIVVIAILATITLVSYNVIRDKARATALVTEILKVEEAFRLLGADQFVPEYWRDNYFTGSGNPSLDSIVSSTAANARQLQKYLPEAPKVSGMDGLSWVYDNDKDVMSDSLKNTCPRPNQQPPNWTSVVMVITPVDSAIVQKVDDQMDDGDLRCGRIMSNGSGLQYQLSYNQKF